MNGKIAVSIGVVGCLIAAGGCGKKQTTTSSNYDKGYDTTTTTYDSRTVIHDDSGYVWPGQATTKTYPTTSNIKYTADGRAYVLDSRGGMLYLDAAGRPAGSTTSYTTTNTGSSTMVYNTSDIKYTSDGRGYVVDSRGCTIYVDSTGHVTGYNTSDIRYGSDGRGYVTDTRGSVIYVDSMGRPTGATGATGYTTTSTTVAYGTSDIKYAADGRAYVIDSYGTTIYLEELYQRPMSDVYKPSKDSSRN